MGVSNANAALLLAARNHADRFDRVATLGKQTFWPKLQFLEKLLPAFGVQESATRLMDRIRSDGSQFLRFLGAKSVDEFDASAYEGASVIHDMNNPLPDQYKYQYDVVYDGGSLEHIFDVRQALLNITELLAPGGIFVGSTVANNIMGHGFYQFSPELFFRFFCHENGWGSIRVFLCEHQLGSPRFWEVTDPQRMGHRIEVQNRNQLYLMVIAKKNHNMGEIDIPQQSDYAAAWNDSRTNRISTSNRKPYGRLKRGMMKIMRFVRRIFSFWPRNRGGLYLKGRGLNQPGIRRLTLNELSLMKF